MIGRVGDLSRISIGIKSDFGEKRDLADIMRFTIAMIARCG